MRLRPVLLALATIAVVTVPTGCLVSGTPSECAFTTPTTAPVACPVYVVAQPYTGVGRTLAVVGDSIDAREPTELDAALGPVYRIGIQAHGGYTTDQMMPGATILAADHPVVVAINLGTNDVGQGVSLAGTEAAYARMVGLFPQACVVVTTLSTRTGNVAGFAAINSYLRSAYAHVADWQARTAADPTLLSADLIHPSPSGKIAYAALVRATVDACV